MPEQTFLEKGIDIKPSLIDKKTHDLLVSWGVNDEMQND